MTKNYRILSLLIAFLFLSLLPGCSDDDSGPTDEQRAIDNLEGTWQVQPSGSVLLDDVSKSEWNDFSLTITEHAFTTETADERVFPASGTWKFVGDNLRRIERNDGIVMDVDVSDSILILTFTISESSNGGRINSVSGEYKFTLVKI